MKILVDMITTNPIEVNYANIVIFNRKLLLLVSRYEIELFASNTLSMGSC